MGVSDDNVLYVAVGTNGLCGECSNEEYRDDSEHLETGRGSTSSNLRGSCLLPSSLLYYPTGSKDAVLLHIYGLKGQTILIPRTSHKTQNSVIGWQRAVQRVVRLHARRHRQSWYVSCLCEKRPKIPKVGVVTCTAKASEVFRRFRESEELESEVS